MIFPNFCGGSASERSQSINSERAINWMPIMADSGGPKLSVYNAPTPGIRPFVVVNDGGPVRALFYEDGRCFAVVGNIFVEVFPNNTYQQRGGALAYDDRNATICTNGTAGGQLFITSGGAGYIFTLKTNVLDLITDPDFLRPTAMGAFLDGYFISLVGGTRQFQLSDLEDGLSWSALDVAEVSQSSDNLVSMAVHRRELWLAGSKTTSIWANVGTPEFPFAPVPGAQLWEGTTGPFAIVEIHNAVHWVANNAHGALVVYRSDGYQPQRISTHAIEFYLEQAATVDDIIAYGYHDEGHPFFCLLVPSLQTTLVYDALGPDRAQWHERGEWDEVRGRWQPARPRCSTFAFGRHLVGDRLSGAIYEQHLDFLTDIVVEQWGATLSQRRPPPPIDEATIL